MTKKEFENFFINNKKWFEYKSRYFLNKYNLDYCNTSELISLTVEKCLHNLKDIKKDNEKTFIFFAMRNELFNNFIYKNNTNYQESFEEFNKEDELYEDNFEERKNQFKEILYNRLETDKEKEILTQILEGKKMKDIKTASNFYRLNVIRKIKNLPIKKAKYTKVETKQKNGRKNIYVGIECTCLTTGKKRLYAEISHTKNDGFTPDVVRRCILGKIKHQTHKNHKFTHIEKENNN